MENRSKMYGNKNYTQRHQNSTFQLCRCGWSFDLEIMVIDLRKQKRTIKIELEITGYSLNLDSFVDNLVDELKIVCEQRKLPTDLKIEIILE